MRKKLAMVLVTLFTAGTILVSCGVNNSKNEVVEFQDPLVERCVRKTLDKAYDEEITRKDCESIKSLLIDCKYDTSFTMRTNTVTDPADLMCNYIDFCDFQYLTGLEELYIDNEIKYDLIVNLDALANCTKMKKLCMEYNPMADWYNGDTPKGYKYLKDILDSMSQLEYLDLGYYVPGEIKEMLRGENTDLVVWDGDNQSYCNLDAIHHRFAYGENKHRVEAESVAAYMNNWSYTYDGNEMDAVKAKSILIVESLEEFMEVIGELPAETEDIVMSVKTMEPLDFSVFTKFSHLKTLSISGNASVLLPTDKYTPVENIAKLKELPELYAFNIAGCSGDFAEIGELTNLKELSILICNHTSMDFLEGLVNLRELTVIESGEEFDACAYVDKLPNLKHLTTSNTGNLAGIENAEALETLRCWNVVETLENVGKCSPLKNIIFTSYSKKVLDMTQLQELEQLEMVINVNGSNLANVEYILDAPNLITVMSGNITVEDLQEYHNEMNALIDKAVENDNLSCLALMVNVTVDGDYSSMVDYADIDFRKLWDAGIYDGAIQFKMHNYEKDVRGKETFEENYEDWKETFSF